MGRGDQARYDSSVGSDVTRPVVGYANLGFAHSASTIVETIVELGHHSIRDFLSHDHEQHWSQVLGVEEWALNMSGEEVDQQTATRVISRLYRDRARERGFFIQEADYFDIPELLGAVQPQVQSAYGPYVAGSGLEARARSRR